MKWYFIACASVILTSSFVYASDVSICPSEKSIQSMGLQSVKPCFSDPELGWCGFATSTYHTPHEWHFRIFNLSADNKADAELKFNQQLAHLNPAYTVAIEQKTYQCFYDFTPYNGLLGIAEYTE